MTDYMSKTALKNPSEIQERVLEALNPTLLPSLILAQKPTIDDDDEEEKAQPPDLTLEANESQYS